MKISTFTPCLLPCILLVSGVVWASCYAIEPMGTQGMLFFDRWENAFGDFFLTCRAWCSPEHYAGDARVPAYELCWPLIAYWPESIFPDSLVGAKCFSIFGLVCLTVGLLIFAFSKARIKNWVWSVVSVLACLCSFHVLFAYERANPIFFSATGVCIFLAWYDSEMRVKRVLAAVMLAIACALKVTPCVFCILYLVPLFERTDSSKPNRTIDWPSILICGFLASALILVPYWVHGQGAKEVCALFGNMTENAHYYRERSSWGFVPIWRELTFAGICPAFFSLGLARALNVLVCLFMLLVITCAQRFRLDDSGRTLLLAAVIMLLPANSGAYTALYLLPVMLFSNVEKTRRLVRLCDVFTLGLWFVLFTPFQVPLSWFGCGQNVQLNYAFANFALLLLVGGTFCSAWRRKTMRDVSA